MYIVKETSYASLLRYPTCVYTLTIFGTRMAGKLTSLFLSRVSFPVTLRGIYGASERLFKKPQKQAWEGRAEALVYQRLDKHLTHIYHKIRHFVINNWFLILLGIVYINLPKLEKDHRTCDELARWYNLLITRNGRERGKGTTN